MQDTKLKILTDQDKVSVRSMFWSGTVSRLDLAEAFDCSKWTINRLVVNIIPLKDIKYPNRDANRIWNKETIGWMAGMIEGEATISRELNQIKISIESVDEDVIDKLINTGIGTKCGPYRRASRPENQPIFLWHVNKQKDAARLLTAIYPLLCSRRRAKIQEVLW